MKKYLALFLFIPLSALAQHKISEFLNVTTLASNQLFVVTSTSATTNNNFSFGQLTNQLRNAIGLTNFPDLSATYELHVSTLTNLIPIANVTTPGVILTNGGTTTATYGTLTVTNLTTTTFNVTTQNVGTIVLTNVDGSFWTNLTGANITGTIPSGSLPNTGSAGTYRSVTFDAQGREISGSNPTTFSAYAISDTSANLATALTDETGTGVAVFSDSPVFTTKVTVPQVNYTTNQNQITPDFTLGFQLISTNAAFTFLAPVGIDTGKTTCQSTAIYVTNTTAVVVNVTAPANCHAVGTMNVTNLTRFTFETYASKFTNVFAVPVF